MRYAICARIALTVTLLVALATTSVASDPKRSYRAEPEARQIIQLLSPWPLGANLQAPIRHQSVSRFQPFGRHPMERSIVLLWMIETVGTRTITDQPDPILFRETLQQEIERDASPEIYDLKRW